MELCSVTCAENRPFSPAIHLQGLRVVNHAPGGQGQAMEMEGGLHPSLACSDRGPPGPWICQFLSRDTS